MKAAAKTIIILSILGVLNAGYLTYLFVQERQGGLTTTFCDINNTLSCSSVITSPYAQLFGVPICTIALFVYPFLILLAALSLKEKTPKDYFFALGILSAMGTTMNLIYIYNEFAYIGAFCILCIVCGLLIITNLIVSIIGYSKSPCCVPVAEPMSKLATRMKAKKR